MEKVVILTESDIMQIVKNSIVECYMLESNDEGKVANSLAALSLIAGGVVGFGNNQHANNKHTDVTNRQNKEVFNTPKQEIPKDTVNYNDKIETVAVDNKVTEPYYPSDNLIDFIKSYETFHEGWKNDGFGNPTTGWGFKITPELKRRFPNGMHRDENGNTPEADSYIFEYIDKHMDEFRRMTPNLDSLPQEYGDALFDVYYNVGGTVYYNSPKLQKALKEMDLEAIADNLEYGSEKGHKLRSMDRKNITKGIYKRTYK